MFRITSHGANDDHILKLEGCLDVGCVPELYASWREASRIPGRSVRVDLTDVCHVDDAGVELLMVMYRAGTGFETRGCFMRELVREISEAIDGGPAAGAPAVNAGSGDEAFGAKTTARS
jgi:ABC-type transporter Mla MlaB component